MTFWDTAGGIIVAGAIALTLLGSMVFGTMWGCAEWNKHNAPLAAAVCAQSCGASGVHTYNTDFKCECNETHRFDGKPSLDVNISNREAR